MHIPAEPAERSRPGMSTGRITAAALQIVDTEGSQALTMRRLGQALDRKVMTLYRYVPSKDALLDGVVARVLTDLAINPAAADWRQELRDLHALHAYRLFFGFLHGHIVDEIQEIIDNPDEADDLLRLGLHRLPRREFPRIRAVAPELASYDGAAHLQQGVALMITGLQSHFQPARTSPTT
jgi:AcrR family transcriptional regulator